MPDIEKVARWTVVENEREGPVIKRWEPSPTICGQLPFPAAVASGLR